MKKNSRILVTGASGLLGTALQDMLIKEGYENIFAPTSEDLDLLTSCEFVSSYFDKLKPEYVFHLAGSVYGIGGNLRDPSRIFLENILINTHVLEASRRVKAKKILALGSICSYPSPPILRTGGIHEDDLFFGEPHHGERSYGQAKRAMLAQLEANYISGLDFCYVISSNLYGPNDHFNLDTGHVIPSLIRKFYEASQSGNAVEIWGDGQTKRDIVHSWDAAMALIKAMKSLSGRVNLASGRMMTILDIAKVLGNVSGVKDNFIFDKSKPKGHEFPGINIDRLKSIGFEPIFTAEAGLHNAYEWYSNNHNIARH